MEKINTAEKNLAIGCLEDNEMGVKPDTRPSATVLL